MSKTVKCIAHYDAVHGDANPEKRNTFLAACTKLDYMFDCFRQLHCPVSILSACGTTGRAAVRGQVKMLDESTTLELLAHGGKGHKIKNIVSELTFRYRFWKRLKQFVQDGDTVLVYHSLALIDPIMRLKKHRRFRLILEVEEIYGDVGQDARAVRREYAFFKCADAFVFPTESLHRKVNRNNKPYVISHGTYRVVEPLGDMVFDDDKIHCLYAGTLDPRKGGGPMAIQAAAYLPEKYHMHILGFGTPKELADAKALLATVSEQAACTLTYDGVLSGEEYLRFLQSCDIGLSTQNPNAAFNDTSFPSKILSYMANGVRVVSVRIPVVEDSKVSHLIAYYEEPTPQAVAQAIMSVDMTAPYDSREVLRSLDRDFCRDLDEMLNGG